MVVYIEREGPQSWRDKESSEATERLSGELQKQRKRRWTSPEPFCCTSRRRSLFSYGISVLCEEGSTMAVGERVFIFYWWVNKERKTSRPPSQCPSAYSQHFGRRSEPTHPPWVLTRPNHGRPSSVQNKKKKRRRALECVYIDLDSFSLRCRFHLLVCIFGDDGGHEPAH